MQDYDDDPFNMPSKTQQRKINNYAQQSNNGLNNTFDQPRVNLSKNNTNYNYDPFDLPQQNSQQSSKRNDLFGVSNNMHNESDYIRETKEAPQSNNLDPFENSVGQKPTNSNFDPFGNNPSSSTQNNQDLDDMFGNVQPKAKMTESIPYYSKPQQNTYFDPFGNEPQPSNQPTNNKNDLDVFFEGSNQQPTPAPPRRQPEPKNDIDDMFGVEPVYQNTPHQTQNAQPTQNNDLDDIFGVQTSQNVQKVPNMRNNTGALNRTGISGYSVYNELNTSNMKDMSAMGINNFLDIETDQTQKEVPVPQNKFDLREEQSGTQFDNNQSNK